MKSRKIFFWVGGVITASLLATAAQGPEEIRPEQRKRKIEVCGETSLTNDTLGNFDSRQTGWFPGRAKVLFDPHEALLAKLILVQNAKSSIDISTYVFANDEFTRAMLDALSQANARGVNVRFMVDAGGSFGEAFKDQYRHLRTLLLSKKIAEQAGLHPGSVDMTIFRPLARIKTWDTYLKEHSLMGVDASSDMTINPDRRSHDKIFLVDRDDREHTVAIVGGRNFHNAYYGYPKVDQNTYEDMEVVLTNDPSSTDSRTLSNTLGKHFQDLFCAKGNRWLSLERISEQLDGTSLETLGDVPSRLALQEIEGASDALMKTGDFSRLYAEMRGRSGIDFLNSMTRANLMSGNEIQNIKHRIRDVLIDPNEIYVENAKNGNSIYYQLQALVVKAQDKIDVCTPYIFLSQNERDCLKQWTMAKPGRKVRILSNSAATSDSSLAMATFDLESAPEATKSGHYRCENVDTHEVAEGEFDNSDGKIQVYELGRLDNIEFTKGPVRDSKGKLVEPRNYYGKLHAKFGIIDGRISFVGSHNLDQRSKHLNSETAFFIESPEVANDLTQAFEKMLARSYLYNDPDLQIMNERPEVKNRRRLMSLFSFINQVFPEAAALN